MSQAGSTRKRGKTWTAYWFVTSPDGERVQRTKGGFRTKADAQGHLTTVLGQIQTGGYVEPVKMTVAVYLREQWLPVQELALKPSTFAGYRDIVEGRIIPNIGGVRLAQLTGGHVATMYATLRATGNRRGKNPGTTGLSERSMKHTHTCLHKALEDAVEAGFIQRNPAHTKALAPKPRATEMQVWSIDEVRTFLAATDGDRLHAAYVVALANGLRRGELLGLRWDDVDLEAAKLSVRRARVDVGYDVHEGAPKTDRSTRMLDLDEGVVAALRAHRRRQLEDRMAWGAAWTDTGYLFTLEDGTPMHPQTFAWQFGKAVRAAGVTAIRPHDMRHTCATIALRQGVAAKVVQEMLGHSSISITLDLYTHVVPGMQREAAAKIGAAIFG